VESISRARNLEPLRGTVAVNEMVDTGDLCFVGDMDIPEEEQVVVQKVDQRKVELCQANITHSENFMHNGEDYMEIFLQGVGNVAGIDSNLFSNVMTDPLVGELDKHSEDVTLPSELHGHNDVKGDTNAMLIVGDNITLLSQARDVFDKGKGKVVVGSNTKAKWKKRARVSPHPQPRLPTNCNPGTKKRPLRDGGTSDQAGDSEQKKKCKLVSRVVSNNDPISVEAVGQPHQSQ
jgi:hypothetical protein